MCELSSFGVCDEMKKKNHHFWLLFDCRIEIYSLRAVAKQLAGRPDGWNSEFVFQLIY